jgi:K+-transporting ATPase A subunit
MFSIVRLNVLSMVILVSTFVFSFADVAETEKNACGIVLALLVCIVLFSVVVHTFTALKNSPKYASWKVKLGWN